MSSTLTWLDHDAEARERSLRILALFQEKESRDDLGIGGLRDALADVLFPGTSTIQTRLRYMLFVPWVYLRIEGERRPADQFGARARKLELALVQPLLSNDDKAGVFGRTAGNTLKRLPSSVYWFGLGAWGIRRFDGSRDEYYRSVERIYRRRDQRTTLRDQRTTLNEDEVAPDPTLVTWHPRLPDPPKGFPEKLTFSLTNEEASFLLDRIVATQKDSLLAHLAMRCKPAGAIFPWEHPERASFSPGHKEILDHARRFSEMMHGAAILYNLALSEVAERAELVQEHREGLSKWVGTLDLAEMHAWSLARFWELTMDQGHSITRPTREFVTVWVDLVLAKPKTLVDDASARVLISLRERSLKRSRSRFDNVRARDQWGGRAGLGRLSYRWPTAQSFLADLHAGLQGG